MVTNQLRVYTKEIGDALATLIKAVTVRGETLKACQLGQIEHVAAVGQLEDYLPAVFIKPVITQREPYTAQGTWFDVDDTFRICYAFSTEDNTVNPYDAASDGLDDIAQALAADHVLSAISSTISPSQVSGLRPDGIDWTSEELLAMQEFKAPAYVAVDVVTVRWLSKG